MSSPQGSLAKDRLGVPSVVFFVMSAAAPLTVIAGVVTTGYAVSGILGVPFAFIAIAVMLIVFSVGYVAMSRHINNAGAFYTFITKGLSRPLGVGGAWMALVAYNALQIGLYGIIGTAVSNALAGKPFNVANPPKWWVIALIAWALVAILGVLRVDINGTVLAVLLCAEIIITIVFDVAYLAKPGADLHGSLTFDTLLPNNLFVAGFGAVLVFTFLGFVGFESAVVFSEESRNPRRTIAMATYLAVIIIGALYALSSWAMSVATGPDNIIKDSGEQGPALIFGLAASRLPEIFVQIGTILFATSVIAAMISFHNTVARYTFALGRERVFPVLLGSTSRGSGAPIAGSIVQSIVGLAVIVLYAVTGWDPVVRLFFWFGTAGGFGILTLMTLTSIAIIVYFARSPQGENAFRRIVAPLIALAALCYVLYYAVKGFDVLLGVTSDDPLRWIIPVVFPVVGVIGIFWALVIRATRPDTYQTIGHGGAAAAVIPQQDRVVASEQPADPSGVS